MTTRGFPPLARRAASNLSAAAKKSGRKYRPSTPARNIAAITSNLGVFAIIGGFVVGVAVHDDRRFVEEWKRRVWPIVWVFFLPIFFAYTGLRTDIAAIQGWTGLVTLLLGADTLVGPVFLAYGWAESGHERLYLTVGRSF